MERIHIGIFGPRNAGKSSLVNMLTGQDVSIVSPVAGTTTDPVSKPIATRKNITQNLYIFLSFTFRIHAIETHIYNE